MPRGSSPLARGLRRGVAEAVGGARIIPARAGFTPSPSARRRPGRDHPRSRGVYVITVAQAAGTYGSSPLARGLPRPWPWSCAPRPDHPRSRGVYPRVPVTTTIVPGSSPLARGLPPRHAPRRHARRIIPARAGFTRSPAPAATAPPDHPRSRGVYGACGGGRRWGVRDHPRSRGVYAGRPLTGPGRGGSSPLARGLRRPATDRPGPGGIIPARAGFTSEPGRPSGAAWDHPRSRGVYGGVNLQTIETDGSSPLARGLPGEGPMVAGLGGIIPARAGFTSVTTVWSSSDSDHPRSRGVYGCGAAASDAPGGSSPLARGLPICDGVSSAETGIIPARAGFTSSGACEGLTMRGSSPLARGLLRLPLSFGCSERIIPARAGFTDPPVPPYLTFRDHPRSRGVYHFVSFRSVARNWIIPARAGFTRPAPPRRRSPSGSSPLARGLQKRLGVAAAHARIIPARAGFTGSSGPGGSRCGDHPRSRGVYTHERRTGDDPTWIIPARAGFTQVHPHDLAGCQDHPRSRGVYLEQIARDVEKSGSSPLARGLPTMARWREAVMVDHPRSRGVYERIQPWPDKKPGSSPLARGLPRPCKISSARPGIIPARAGFTAGTARTMRMPRDHPRSRGVYRNADF